MADIPLLLGLMSFCLMAAHVGAECKSTDFRSFGQCTAGLKCSQEQCALSPSTCGSSCDAYNSICPPKTYQKDDKCIPYTDSICPANSVFEDGVCKLKLESTPQISTSTAVSAETTCESNCIVYDDNCSECPPSAVAINNECVRQIATNPTCPIGSSMANEMCIRDTPCPYATIPIGGICATCPSGAIALNGQCFTN